MKCPTCYLTEGPLGFAVILLAAVVLIRTVAGGGVAPVPPMFDQAVSFDQAMEQSKDSGKPVFAFVTADWCGPCQAFKRGALANDKVIDFVTENTQPVYIDGDEHPELVQSLGVTGYPTIVLIKDNAILDARSGGMTTSTLLAWLDQTITN